MTEYAMIAIGGVCYIWFWGLTSFFAWWIISEDRGLAFKLALPICIGETALWLFLCWWLT